MLMILLARGGIYQALSLIAKHLRPIKYDIGFVSGCWHFNMLQHLYFRGGCTLCLPVMDDVDGYS